MQVHGDNVVAACHSQHVRDKLRCDGCTRLVLLVHAGIREAGDDSRDAASRRRPARRDKDEELHEMVIDVVAPGLDDENIFVADRLGNFDIGLAVGELFNGAGNEGHAEPRICEQITSLWTVSMAATHGEAAHRSVTAWASSGWLFPVRRPMSIVLRMMTKRTDRRGL